MIQAATPTLTLEEFLELPETKPATVLIVFPEQRVQLLREDASLPILPGIELALTVNQVFSWLAFA